MPYSAIIFDLDGTLLDTLADIGNSANAVLGELGLPQHPLEDYKVFVGDGVVTLFERAAPACRNDAALRQQCVAGFTRIYGENWHTLSKPYPGIQLLLDDLVERGLQMAVLSNKPHAFTVEVISHFFPRYDFRVVLGQREGVAKKPDPAGVNEILHLLGISRDECLFLGDSSVDMQTAHAAGVKAIGASWGFRTVAELQEYKAAVILDTPLELLPLLDAG